MQVANASLSRVIMLDHRASETVAHTKSLLCIHLGKVVIDLLTNIDKRFDSMAEYY